MDFMLILFVKIFILCHFVIGFPQMPSNEEDDIRVVGGTKAGDGEVPFQVSLRDTSNRHFCGGTLISDTWILTAAHCVVGDYLSDVVVGTNSRTKGGDKYRVIEKIPHPEYDSDKIINDIALVRTNESIKFNDKVKSIELGQEFTPAGEKLILCGWGRTSYPGSLPEDLQCLTLNVIENKDCKDKIGSITEVTESQICTLNRLGQGACHGDSGGPLVTTDKAEVRGVVSKGIPCARGQPDMFTSVFSFRDWIHDTMNKDTK